jgi:hypothetical protein
MEPAELGPLPPGVSQLALAVVDRVEIRADFISSPHLADGQPRKIMAALTAAVEIFQDQAVAAQSASFGRAPPVSSHRPTLAISKQGQS